MRSSSEVVMENMSDGVVAVGNDGTIAFRNSIAAELFPERSVLDDRDPLKLKATWAAEEPIRYFESTLQRDSETKTLAVGTSLVRDERGEIEMVIAVFRDITEQRRLAEQLQRKEKLTALGELAGGVAHEIRNPLNAIGIIAQRLHGEFTPEEGEEEYDQLIAVIRKEVDRVNAIITQFLSFAKPPKLQRVKEGLHIAVLEALRTVESQAKSRGIDIELDVRTHAEVHVDRNIFKQAVMNLLQNSIEAMIDGGRISMTIERSNRTVLLRIKDDGPGIPEDIRKKMFNLYFTTKPTGTGLGLSIVHQIISEHDGSIRAESAPGQGTEFIVELPVAATEEEETP